MNKSLFMKVAGLMLLTIGVAAVSFAKIPVDGPEIDAAIGGNALALLSGALLIIRSRKR